MTKPLNHREEEVMAILWQKGHAFVNDILEAMGEPKPPYNTVSSIVRKLESEGLVGHEAFGKNFRYYPILSIESYRSNALSRVLDQLFDRSPMALLSHFVEQEQVDAEELEKLLENIKQREGGTPDML